MRAVATGILPDWRTRMNPKRSMVLALTCLAISLGFAAAAFAQANITGSILGSVTDDSGNFLPGATIEIAGEPLGSSTRSVITDAEGTFTLNGLPVGVYSMTVTLIGYRPYELVQIIINPD